LRRLSQPAPLYLHHDENFECIAPRVITKTGRVSLLCAERVWMKRFSYEMKEFYVTSALLRL